MNFILLTTAAQSTVLSSKNGYITGAVIAFLILVYLAYSLIKPEKF